MDCFLKIFFTVCTAPLFSYSAIFIAASVQINSLSLEGVMCWSVSYSQIYMYDVFEKSQLLFCHQ